MIIFFTEYEFVLTDIQFKIMDVSGEREERVRWIDFLAVSLRNTSKKNKLLR